MPRNLRTLLKDFTTPFALDDVARRIYVEAALLGERAQRLTRGAPKASEAALLVAGGRSGSTWIASILSAGNRVQQIFEPLHPSTVPEVRCLTGWKESRHPHIRSVYLRPDGNHPAWEDFLERVLTGRVRNYWTDVVRTSYLPRRYLIKMIRANLMLGFLIDRFDPRVGFVVRHPCAVVSSRLVAGWHADVADLLCQEALVEDHLRPWLTEIEAERDILGAHAVWWAVEILVASRQLSSRPHHFAPYEAILANPRKEAVAMAEALGIRTDGIARVDFGAPSRMASSDLQRVGPAITRWRRHLGGDDGRRILAWADRMGLDWYAPDGSPKVPSGRVPAV